MREENEITDWFRAYHNDIYNFLIYYTGGMDVEDLVQETFVKAVRNIHKYAPVVLLLISEGEYVRAIFL